MFTFYIFIVLNEFEVNSISVLLYIFRKIQPMSIYSNIRIFLSNVKCVAILSEFSIIYQ